MTLWECVLCNQEGSEILGIWEFVMPSSTTQLEAREEVFRSRGLLIGDKLEGFSTYLKEVNYVKGVKSIWLDCNGADAHDGH
jgi:hypothetical protein